jgi:hypothetical protein
MGGGSSGAPRWGRIFRIALGSVINAISWGQRLLERYTVRMLPLETVTVAEAFQEVGYKTAFVGKWHMHDHDHTTGFPEDQGYEINIGGRHKGAPPGGCFAAFENPKMEDKPEQPYLTDRLGDEAVSLIEDYAGAGEDPLFPRASIQHGALTRRGEA